MSILILYQLAIVRYLRGPSFASGSYLLSFIHIPTFFRDLHDPNLRARMQPALIMSALAMAALMKSSEIELGSEGRARALRLRDTAQTMLEAACSSQSIDYTLAEAALVRTHILHGHSAC